MVLICISLMINDVETYLCAYWLFTYLEENAYSCPLALFKLGCLFFVV